MGQDPGDGRGYVQDVGPVQPPSGRRRSGGLVLLVIAIVVGWLALRQWLPLDGPGSTFRFPTPSPTGAAAISPSGSISGPTRPPAATRGPNPAMAGVWRQTAPAPIDGRLGHVLAWTGTEVLVWGGIASGPDAGPWLPRDGAAYNPGGDTWRTIPAAPIAGRERPLAAWSGTELLVWGGVRPPGVPDKPILGGEGTTAPGEAPATLAEPAPVPDGAAYRPATDTWRRLPGAPLDLSDAVGGWLDGTLIVVTSDGAARYHPRDNAWTLLDPAPVRPGGRAGVVAAGRVVVIAFGDGVSGVVEGAILHPGTGTWTHLATPFLTMNAGLTFVGAGDRVLVPEPRFGSLGLQARNIFLRAGLAMEMESWRPTEPCPGAAPGAAWTGRYVIGVLAAYDNVTDRCLDLPPAPPRAAPFDGTNGREDPVGVWTGTEYITWSGPPTGEGAWVPNDGAIFRPAF